MSLANTTKTAATGLRRVPVGRAMDAITAAVEARQGDAALAAMEAPHPNKGALDRFVATALRDAPHKDEPARHLRLSATKLEGYLRELSAAAEADHAPAAHLIGLSALDLSDGMDRLNAAARLVEREGLGAFTASRRVV